MIWTLYKGFLTLCLNETFLRITYKLLSLLFYVVFEESFEVCNISGLLAVCPNFNMQVFWFGHGKSKSQYRNSQYLKS